MLGLGVRQDHPAAPYRGADAATGRGDHAGWRRMQGPMPGSGLSSRNTRSFPWRSVLDNVAFGLEMSGIARDERYRIADQYLDLVGLLQFAQSYPSGLSGMQATGRGCTCARP